MAKLKLVIADKDESHVKRLVDYLTAVYFNQFQVSYFTKETYLINYLSQTDEKADILLISTELFNDLIPIQKADTVILLSEGKCSSEYKDCEVINKFQTGDRLVRSIVNIYYDKNPNQIYIPNGSKSTKVIGVYSPLGGCGKTSISVGLALQLSDRGKAVFYLNLENVQSTPAFFDCDSSRNLSHIFYFLKERSKNLNMKIEGTKIEDLYSGIHYFAPPESAFEFEDISPDEIKYLIYELKRMSCYDTVVIDMSANFDTRSSAVFEACDEILFILTQEFAAEVKTNLVIKELDMILGKNKFDLQDKLRLVLNKYNSNVPCRIENISIKGKTVSFKIPEASPVLASQEEKHIFNLNNNFGEAINCLIDGLYD